MDITAKGVSEASEVYSQKRLETNPFPDSVREYQLLLETAFIEGALWYQKKQIEELDARLAQGKVVANAR